MTKTEIDTVIVMKNALDELRKAAETMSRCMAANHISPLPSFYDAHNRACYALGCAEALAQQGDCQCADQRDCTGACCVSKQQPVAWYDEEMDEAYTATELDGGNTDGLIPLYAGAAPTAQRCDTARVLEWMRTPNRKAAQFAFTEGQERQAAYWIEIAQSEPAALPIAQPDARKVIEQMVKALEIAERHLAYVEITEAREAGQQRLEENK